MPFSSTIRWCLGAGAAAIDADEAGVVPPFEPGLKTCSVVAPRYLLRSSSVHQDGRVLAGRSSA